MRTDDPTPRDLFLSLIQDAGLRKEDLPGILYNSPHTIKAYMKPDTSKSSIEPPRWAIELLAYKTGQQHRIPDLAREEIRLLDLKLSRGAGAAA